MKDYSKWVVTVFYAACFINNFTTCVAELEYNNNETADAKHTSSSSPNNTVSAIWFGDKSSIFRHKQHAHICVRGIKIFFCVKNRQINCMIHSRWGNKRRQIHAARIELIFQPVLHDWRNKGCGMYYPVCGLMHIKEPLLLIGKSSPCGGSVFPLSLSEWSFIICLTPYNRK